MTPPRRLPDTRIAVIDPAGLGSPAAWRAAFTGAKTVEVFAHAAQAVRAGADVIVVADATSLAGSEMDALSKAPTVLAFVASGTHELSRLIGSDQEVETAYLGEGEWFVSPRPGLGIQGEFPVRSALVELTTQDAACKAAAMVSVGFRNRSVALSRGRMHLAGFSAKSFLENIDLSRFALRLALGPLYEHRQVSVGVVGYGPYGGMGHFHGAGCEATPGLRFAAIAEPSEERRESAVAQFPGIAAHSDTASLYRDPEVDLVIIATPPSTHFQLARDALEAGKHVALEKPMALTVAEADELIRVAKERDLLLTVHQNRRFDADYLALARLIEEGTLGEVFNVETFVGSFEHPCRAWHSDESVSGGAAYDWGSHHIDWILQLYKDRPTEIFVTGHKRVWHDVTNVDQVTIRMVFGDGREATFVQSDVAGERKPKFYVQGTKGTATGWYAPVRQAEVEFPFGYRLREFHHAEAPVELSVTIYEGHGRTHSMRVPPARTPEFAFHANLAGHLHYGEPLAVSPESVRPVIEILEVAQNLSENREHHAKL